MLRWCRIGLTSVLALAAASLFAAPASESTTRQLIVKFKDDGTTRRALPLQNRLALLADDAGTTLSYVRPMALDAHVVALDHAVPLNGARDIAAMLATNADVEYAQ